MLGHRTAIRYRIFDSLVETFFSKEIESSLKSLFGQEWHHHLLMSLVASPNVNSFISTFALMSLVYSHGLEPLDFDDRFRRALIKKKIKGPFGTNSVVGALVEAARED